MDIGLPMMTFADAKIERGVTLDYQPIPTVQEKQRA